jgi:pimeloyl-ACP methyl ester carboxylesterase
MFLQKDIIDVDYKLSYRLYEGGNKYLIMFHGFGQNLDIMNILAEQLTSSYTVISIGLFFHENNFYVSTSKIISIECWEGILNQILITEKVEQFELLGFSMGARFVVASLGTFHNRIDQIILIAPDGIYINFWYRLAMFNEVSRKLFKYFLYHPQFLFRISEILTEIGLVDDRITSFAASQMQNKEQIQQVYHSWLYFRKLKMDDDTLIRLCKSENISVKMIFGTKDRIIKQKTFSKFIKKINAEVIQIHTTHSKLIQELSTEKEIFF